MFRTPRTPVGRDGNSEGIEQYLCRLYGCLEQQYNLHRYCSTTCSKEVHDPDIDVCRYRLFMKARKALDLLPPPRDALQLQLAHCNEQAKVWIFADDATFTAQDPLRYAG